MINLSNYCLIVSLLGFTIAFYSNHWLILGANIVAARLIFAEPALKSHLEMFSAYLLLYQMLYNFIFRRIWFYIVRFGGILSPSTKIFKYLSLTLLHHGITFLPKSQQALDVHYGFSAGYTSGYFDIFSDNQSNKTSVRELYLIEKEFLDQNAYVARSLVLYLLIAVPLQYLAWYKNQVHQKKNTDKMVMLEVIKEVCYPIILWLVLFVNLADSVYFALVWAFYSLV